MEVLDDKMAVGGTDQEISYLNNINVGTATATVTFLGNYTGMHRRTSSGTKMDGMVKNGLKPEAVAWYGVKLGVLRLLPGR